MRHCEPDMDFPFSSQITARDDFPCAKSFPNNFTNLRAELVLPTAHRIFLEQAREHEAYRQEHEALRQANEALRQAKNEVFKQAHETFNQDVKETSSEIHGHGPYAVSVEQAAKMAGMKIFATIMLNAWRRRREDAKRLAEKIEDLKRCSMKAKNQLHVYNTLFRVEQKRNDELTCQLKHSMDNINQAKSSCEGLTTSVISLKADKALLEQELRTKYKEADGLNCVLAQTKADLYDSLVEQRKLQVVLRKEQRNVQFLENQKNKLINEICDLGGENRKIEEKFLNELQCKDAELLRANEQNEVLEARLIDLKEKAFRLLEHQETDARLRQELKQLRTHVQTLEKQLEQTLGNRWKACRERFSAYQKSAWRATHLAAFFLLPAMPPPASHKLPL